MLSKRVGGNRRDDEAGYTVAELIVVTAIMAVVLVIAGTALISMTFGTKRGSAIVSEQQQASTTLSQFANDLRSSHALVVPSGVNVSNQVEMDINTPTGPCSTAENPGYPAFTYQPIQWVYQPGPSSKPLLGTLTRQTLSCTGTVVSSGWKISGVVNGSPPGVFRYYNQYGADISTALNGAIAACTTRMAIDVKVGSTTLGTKAYEERENVALTDQVNILSQPGNGQC